MQKRNRSYHVTSALIGLSMLLHIIVVVIAVTVSESNVTLEFTNEQANKRGKTDLRIRTCGATGLPILSTLFDIVLQNLMIYETRER